MTAARDFIPRPRRSGLVSQDLEDEVLLYDSETHLAFSMNALASRIWALCDGQRPVDVIAANAALQPDVVLTAINQFAEAGLLKNGPEVPTVNLSRRRILGRLAFGPVILMVVAPLAKAAASCVPPHQSCNPTQTCCSTGELCPPVGGRCP